MGARKLRFDVLIVDLFLGTPGEAQILNCLSVTPVPATTDPTSIVWAPAIPVTHLLLAAAVDAGAAGEHERLNPVKARQLEQARGGLHVGVHVHERVLDGGPHARTGGHVHDPLHALLLEDARDEGRVAQVALEELDPVGAVLLKEHGDVGALGVDVIVAVDLGASEQRLR